MSQCNAFTTECDRSWWLLDPPHSPRSDNLLPKHELTHGMLKLMESGDEDGFLVKIVSLILTSRSWTNGTRLWLVWWRTSVRLLSIPKSSWTCSWSARTRSKHVSRSVSTLKCLAVSLRLSSTLPKSWVVSACCPWATFLFHSQTCGKSTFRLFVVPSSVQFSQTLILLLLHQVVQADRCGYHPLQVWNEPWRRPAHS